MKKKRPNKSINFSKIDKNFETNAGQNGLKWIDAFDRRISLRGIAWPLINRKTKNFRRLPDDMASSLPKAVQILSYSPSSVFLAFYSDTENLSIQMQVTDLNQMDHMAATGMSGAELYFRHYNSWRSIGSARPSLTERSFTRSLLENAVHGYREYRIYLPLYRKVEKVTLGFDKGAKVVASPLGKKNLPIFFYGTSITQGGCASTAGGDFVSTVGRLLGEEVINFGFSGNGKGEPEIAELISNVKVKMFVLDYVANTTPESLHQTLPVFVDILRRKQPNIPIVMLGCIAFGRSLLNNVTRMDMDRKRDILMKFYLNRKEFGDMRIFYIDGNGLLSAGCGGSSVDGVHPTSAGFATMAERLTPQLSEILISTGS